MKSIFRVMVDRLGDRECHSLRSNRNASPGSAVISTAPSGSGWRPSTAGGRGRVFHRWLPGMIFVAPRPVRDRSDST